MRGALHWRAMTTLDLVAVEAIAAIVHPRFPEDTAVFAERLRLYPDGARLLEVDGVPAGYLVSHPWRFGTVPKLNSRLGGIPANADTFYLHDLALLPVARGTGAGAMIVDDIVRHAWTQGFPSVSLVAVNGSQPFWHRHGFAVAEMPELRGTLAGYEAAARFMVKAACVVTNL